MSKYNSLIDGNNHTETLSRAEGLSKLLANVETDGLTDEALVAMTRLQHDVADAIRHVSDRISYEKLARELEAYGVPASGLSHEEVRQQLLSQKETCANEQHV